MLKCKCGCSRYFLRYKGNAIGAYCLSCGSWIKWVGKKDVSALKRQGFNVYQEDYVPACLQVESESDCNDDSLYAEKDESSLDTYCRFCKEDYLEKLRGRDIKLSMYDGVLDILDESGKLIASFKIEHCPKCGEKF